MKRLIPLILALAMVLSMTACGCRHEATTLKLICTDTTALTAQWEEVCSQCAEVVGTKETATGIAPVEGLMPLSPQDWFACLSTNILNYGANQTIMPVEADPQDNALLYSVVNLSGLKSAIAFYDKEGTVLTIDRKAEVGAVNSIHIQAQFNNDTAPHFFLLVALLAITNNSDLTAESATQIASQIMDGAEVTDNGYVYQLSITSVEDHTVQLIITAQA